MHFTRLKVRTRVYLGFAALLALSLGIALFGVFQFSGVDANVRKMDALAGNISRILTLTRQLATIDLAETRYLSDPDPSLLGSATDVTKRADGLLNEADRVAVSAERRQIYRSVKEALAAHGTNIDRFAQLGSSWNAERAKLFTGGDALTAAAGRLVQAARAAHNPALSDAAAVVESTTLLVRVANWRFMATLDKNGPATFKTNAGHAHAAIEALQRVATPDVAALVQPVQTALSDYETAFAAFSSARLAAAAFYAEQMRPQLEAMQHQLDTAVESQSHDFSGSRAVAAATISGASWWQEVLAVAALALGAGLAFVIGRGIARPLAAMTGAMGRLAAGEHDVEIPARENHDEIGEMARAVEVFKQQAIEAARLAAEQAAARAAKERRQAAMEQHTQDFGQSISGVMASLAGAAEGMRRASEAMADAATAVHSEAHSTAGAAAKSSEDLVTVAAAVEELTSSVAEISRQVSAAADVARQAVQRAEASHGTMQGLSDATARIGDVVRLISDIAGQTNLLALNATIEAARAGEAGKGFAVVAGEVKTLAAQTAKATAEIGGQIETVRAATSDAVAAMSEIGGIIGQMDQVSAAISAAVEQQNATTKEIAASVQAVSGATASTANAMEHVVTVADKAGGISRDVLSGAAEIGREAETLRIEVDQFLDAVRDDGNAERRQYERLAVRGMTVGVRAKGYPAADVMLRNISRGGAAIECAWNLSPGTPVELEIPGTNGWLPARVSRGGGGALAVVFSAEPQVLASIDRVLASLTPAQIAA